MGRAQKKLNQLRINIDFRKNTKYNSYRTFV